MKSFFTTYRSFTTPQRILEKLKQRFNAPSKIANNDREFLHLRVGEVLLYWVENQFIDFDDNLVSSLNDFLSNSLKSYKIELFETILSQMKKLNEIRKNKNAIFQKPPTNLLPPQGQYNPGELFYQMSSDEISRQMTIIDWSIFLMIEPSELLNQSWNKSSLQHRSQNVFALVSRLNKISYWIPSIILWQVETSMRVSMMMKFMEIGIFLHKLNNFNGLMGIIAGLNMSSISRLKKTWSMINEQNSSLLSQYRKLESIMNPTNSWKNYRYAIANARVPAIPYLGIKKSISVQKNIT